MKQRVISMVLAAAMVLGLCLPVGAEAAQTPPGRPGGACLSRGHLYDDVPQ